LTRNLEKEKECKRQYGAIVIQRNFRGYSARKKFRNKILSNFKQIMPNFVNDDEIELKPCLQIYHALSHYLLIWKPENDSSDRESWEKICRYILKSIESDSIKFSYIAVALNKDHSLSWIRHMKKVLFICCNVIDTLKPETHQDTVTLSLMLRTLIELTCPNGWSILKSKQLAPMKPAMQQICNNILGYLIQKGFFLTLRVWNLMIF
jgi:ubiquitin-protein ligase E3 B